MALLIYGAGMAGLLAAQMLRRHRPTVFEAQPALPDNHGALLRFRTDAVPRAVGIPFRQVRVLKAIYNEYGMVDFCSLRDANMYAQKVTGGSIATRSILDLSPVDRYIAPPDFLEWLAYDREIQYNMEMSADSSIYGQHEVPIISTIPMPKLMEFVGWPDVPKFRWLPVWSVRVTLPPNVDVYQTVYFPEEKYQFYRASITGRELIIEYASDPGPELASSKLADIGTVCRVFGLGTSTLPRLDGTTVKTKRQEYGKLLPLSAEDDKLRRAFILAMSDQHNIYSIGRFATWRQILLDDVVHDVQVVERFITERSAYARRLANV